MSTSPLFPQKLPVTGGWEDTFIGMITVLLPIVIMAIVTKRRNVEGYDAGLAWLRALMYFCVCLLLSWATGVFNVLVNSPIIMDPAQLENPVWWGALIAILAFQLYAYFRIWPSGTFHLNRPKYIVPAFIFALLWGFCEAQLFLVFWSLIEMTGLDRIWVGILTYFAVGLFYAPWHPKYWDIYVAPEHNIKVWDMKKVIRCHTPNMVLGLVFLGFFESVPIYIAMNTLCLIGSTYYMRFPAPWDKQAGKLQADKSKLAQAIEGNYSVSYP
jgi:hypothetical protein